MPKVIKKAGGREDDLLQAAAPMSGIEAGVEEPQQGGQQAAAAQQQQQGGDGDGAAAAPKPKFPPMSSYEQNGRRIEFRRVPVPQHRMTPLKNAWLQLYKPVTENLKLDMRMNLKTRKARARGRGGCCRRGPALSRRPRRRRPLLPPAAAAGAAACCPAPLPLPDSRACPLTHAPTHPPTPLLTPIHAMAQVEIKTTPDTPDAGNLQRAADFVHAYILGFEVQVRRTAEGGRWSRRRQQHRRQHPGAAAAARCAGCAGVAARQPSQLINPPPTHLPHSSTGRHRAAAPGRPVHRVLRGQGRQDAARRAPGALHRAHGGCARAAGGCWRGAGAWGRAGRRRRPRRPLLNVGAPRRWLGRRLAAPPEPPLNPPPPPLTHPSHQPTNPPTRAGKNGKTKFTIENATRTRIVLADTRIHILGSFQNIRAARDSICALILGSPAGKVYSRLHSVTTRLSQSY